MNHTGVHGVGSPRVAARKIGSLIPDRRYVPVTKTRHGSVFSRRARRWPPATAPGWRQVVWRPFKLLAHHPAPTRPLRPLTPSGTNDPAASRTRVRAGVRRLRLRVSR